MDHHLSIVVPVHTIPKGKGLAALACWSIDLPEGCELILSLDVDSKDESLREWCESYITSSRIITQRKNGNPGDTRNMGMRLATGEWIAFVDSDDYFYPKQALKAISHIGELSDLIVCRYKSLDHNDNLISEGKKVSRMGELNVSLGFWRCLYRKSLATSTSFPPFRMAEDQVYFSRILTLNPRVNFSDETIYGYVFGGDQQLTKLADAKADLKKSISILQSELSLSKIHIVFRKQILLRQHISFLKSAGLVDKVLYLIKLLRLLVNPSYFGPLVQLLILLVGNRIDAVRMEKQ